MKRPHAVAWAASAAVVLSAPFAQQLFAEVGTRWPARVRTLGVAASVVPAAAAVLVALWRIRDRRLARYVCLALGLGIGATYIRLTALTFTEAFHFIEYGLLGILFYRAWRPSTGARRGLSDVEGRENDDGSVILLPLIAGTVVGTIDEGFQWLIPIRAGEARDVLLNNVATGCGVLLALGIWPAGRLTVHVTRGSRRRVATWTAVAATIFALFFRIVHVGHDIRDPELGSFRSRYTAQQLADAERDRVDRWRRNPPVVQRRIGIEDHYLTEGLWHVQRRNQSWEAGDLASAWRENRILEKFYAPILETPTYASAAGHRWPPAQREVAAQAGARVSPAASDAYAYPLYVWPEMF